MATDEVEVIIRMGSHSEKEYVEKLIHRFDGIFLGANLLEATPGATASLVVKVCKKESGVALYLDPMTYAFGTYVDPQTGKVRNDLDWIKSDRKVKGKIVRDFKSSYQKLADRLGPPFSTALRRRSAITPADFSEKTLDEVCRSVARYQLGRIREVFEKDPEYESFADYVPAPNAIFAPYFYIEGSDAKAWTDLTIELVGRTASIAGDQSVHAIICAPRNFLTDDSFLKRLISDLPPTGVDGVWLWFSTFDEYSASKTELQHLRHVVEALSSKLDVFNMHGGFYSLALSKYGLRGISHGVGYGEQKDVVPVIGQSTPTVRYYLRDLNRRLSVPDIERCFKRLGIESPKTFHHIVCDCTICKGVVKKSLDQFTEFGETYLSTPNSKRPAQTPAAQANRLHFLKPTCLYNVAARTPIPSRPIPANLPGGTAMKKTFVLCLMLLLAMTVAAQENAGGQASDSGQMKSARKSRAEGGSFSSAIKKMRDDWVAAFNAKHPEKLADFYTSDAVFFGPMGSANGPAAIADNFKKSVDSGVTDLRVTSDHTEHVGNLGYDTGTYNQTAPKQGGGTEQISGKYVVVLRREAGRWKIAAHGSGDEKRQ